MEKKDFWYYVHGKSSKELRDPKKLVWNVIIEDWNGREMIVHNIFDHFSLMNDLISIKKEVKKQFDKEDMTLQDSAEAFKFFEEKVSRVLGYHYFGKSEWEFIATSWPPYVESEEIDRLVQEREQQLQKWDRFYRTDVCLSIGTKMDVYAQIRMNWPQFIDYLWANFDLIKKPRG